MRTVLIFNPISGSSLMAEHNADTPQQHEEAIIAGLHMYDIEPEVRYTTAEDPGDGLAKRAAEEGADMVIAAGGDGTIHAVASGLIGTKSTLGIIAMGTMNNLAHSLGIPHTLEAACAIIAKGETSLIDIGKINDHIFLEVAGIGLEAALFPAAEEFKSSGWLLKIRGSISGLFTLFSYQTAKLRISFDHHRPRSYQAFQVTVCNSPYYGVHMQVASDIVMNDGLLNVVIYKNFSKLEYVRHAISISQGKRVFAPKITHRKVKSVRISADHPVETHADGIPHGTTPALITVMPGVLRVRVPEQVVSGPTMLKEAETIQHHKRT